MSEMILHDYSSGSYDYDQFILSYDPTYPQPPPISIAPFSYDTTIPYSTCQYAYHEQGFVEQGFIEQGLIPDYLFGFDYLSVPLYNCVPVHSADALRLDRQRAQDFADLLCKKYSTSEANTTKLSDLPDDLIQNILQRIGAVEILVNARRVCKAWRKICQGPSMWRVIYMEGPGFKFWKYRTELKKMCRQAIDWSQGQLVDIKIEHFASDGLLKYLAANKRSRQLRRLQITHSSIRKDESWRNLFQKSPLLEEISLISTVIRKETVSNAGQYCLQLKSFKCHEPIYRLVPAYRPSKSTHDEDDFVITITTSMPQLRHLELCGSDMTNRGLQAILDGCPHLLSLDLRRCYYINLDSSCGMLCKERIKDLRLPYDRYVTP